MADTSPSGKVDDFYVRLLTRGDARPVEIGVPEDDPLTQIIDKIATGILEFVQPAVRGSELAPLLQTDHILVRTIPPANIQALTVWIAPRHAIAVNRGLMLYLYRLARAFSEQYIVRGRDDPPAPDESETAGIMATILDWMASPVGAPLVDDWSVGDREVRTAENFTTAAERFVLSHEIGHIFHRHLIADSSQVNPSELSPAELDVRPVAQEIEADVTAVFLTIESMPHSGIDSRAGVAGMHFFLHALGLAERVGASLIDATHLPSDERLAMCHNAMDERYGAGSKLAGSWLDAQDKLLLRLGIAALEERERRRSAASERMAGVFRSTPWPPERDMATDRALLLDEMLALMLRAPSAVVQALADNLLDARSYTHLLETLPEDMLAMDDSWRRHQVAHFIARNSTPQVQAALGVTGF